MKHHHRTEVLSAILEIPNSKEATNEVNVAALRARGFSFPLVTDPEVLDRYPLDTYAYDKEYKLLHATEENGISCADLIRTRGPIHILWLPDGASAPQ